MKSRVWALAVPAVYCALLSLGDPKSMCTWLPGGFAIVGMQQFFLLHRIEKLEARHAPPPAANRSMVSDANE